MSESHAECTAFIERIVYFLDNELAEDDVVEVRLHLDGCGPCHELYDVQRAIKTLVARSCAERAPDDLKAKVLVRLREVQVRVTES
ncbi:MAG: mycothiol system anti-sigma-R factor [Nocardioides sp.]